MTEILWQLGDVIKFTKIISVELSIGKNVGGQIKLLNVSEAVTITDSQQ